MIRRKPDRTAKRHRRLPEFAQLRAEALVSRICLGVISCRETMFHLFDSRVRRRASRGLRAATRGGLFRRPQVETLEDRRLLSPFACGSDLSALRERIANEWIDVQNSPIIGAFLRDALTKHGRQFDDAASVIDTEVNKYLETLETKGIDLEIAAGINFSLAIEGEVKGGPNFVVAVLRRPA